MRSLLKTLLALAIAVVLMFLFRSLVFTLYSVNGDGLEPEFITGDRVVVNRWSYGLRTGGGALFDYGRICRQPIMRGDIVSYEDPSDSTSARVLIGRVVALPNDTIRFHGRSLIVPGKVNCASADFYWIRSINELTPFDSRLLGFIDEQRIIGRVFAVVYSHDDEEPLWTGYRKDRWMLKK